MSKQGANLSLVAPLIHLIIERELIARCFLMQKKPGFFEGVVWQVRISLSLNPPKDKDVMIQPRARRDFFVAVIMNFPLADKTSCSNALLHSDPHKVGLWWMLCVLLPSSPRTVTRLSAAAGRGGSGGIWWDPSRSIQECWQPNWLKRPGWRHNVKMQPVRILLPFSFSSGFSPWKETAG